MGNDAKSLPGGAAVLEISGDIAAAAAVFAGLVLVFFGASLASFEGYSEDQRGAVRWLYRRRAWPAFAALAAALGSCAAGLFAKATHCETASWLSSV
jgi:hypothetical protein